MRCREVMRWGSSRWLLHPQGGHLSLDEKPMQRCHVRALPFAILAWIRVARWSWMAAASMTGTSAAEILGLPPFGLPIPKSAMRARSDLGLSPPAKSTKRMRQVKGGEGNS